MANSLNWFFNQVKNQPKFTRRIAKFATLFSLALVIYLFWHEPASAVPLEKAERAISVWLSKTGSGMELHEIQSFFDGLRILMALAIGGLFIIGGLMGITQGNWLAPIGIGFAILAVFLGGDGMISAMIPDYLTSKASYCKLVDVNNSRFCREDYLIWWNPFSWGDNSQQRYDNPIWTGPRSPGQQNSLPGNLNREIQDILGGRR